MRNDKHQFALIAENGLWVSDANPARLHEPGPASLTWTATESARSTFSAFEALLMLRIAAMEGYKLIAVNDLTGEKLT